MPSEEYERVQQALRDAGLPADDFGRFVNHAKASQFPQALGPVPVFDYEGCVPVLLAVLPTLTQPDAIDATVRHLSTKYAKPAAAEPLMDLFERLPTSDGPTAKWAVGNGINVVATKAHRDRLLAICLDNRHGSDRQMIVMRLGYFKNDPEVTEALVMLIAQEGVALHAMSALRTQLGATAARPFIEPLVDHPSDLVRSQAERELRKIDKTLRKTGSRRRG